jgi:hypothetical protein
LCSSGGEGRRHDPKPARPPQDAFLSSTRDARTDQDRRSLASDSAVWSPTGPANDVAGRVLLDPDTKATLMKTMTCKQLGGPCDLAHHGKDANEVIKAQDRHLRDAVASGATDHEPALTAMKGRWKRPITGMRWYRQAQRDFAALPDEPGGE